MIDFFKIKQFMNKIFHIRGFNGNPHDRPISDILRWDVDDLVNILLILDKNKQLVNSSYIDGIYLGILIAQLSIDPKFSELIDYLNDPDLKNWHRADLTDGTDHLK